MIKMDKLTKILEHVMNNVFATFKRADIRVLLPEGALEYMTQNVPKGYLIVDEGLVDSPNNLCGVRMDESKLFDDRIVFIHTDGTFVSYMLKTEEIKTIQQFKGYKNAKHGQG